MSAPGINQNRCVFFSIDLQGTPSAFQLQPRLIHLGICRNKSIHLIQVECSHRRQQQIRMCPAEMGALEEPCIVQKAIAIRRRNPTRQATKLFLCTGAENRHLV